MIVMQEELNQFKKNKVWSLVPPPKNHSIIGIKWVFKISWMKMMRLWRTKQEEKIDFDETFAPVARLESIWMMLVFACYHDFVVYQMDVKSTFLNWYFKERVYVEKPLGFKDLEKPSYMFKLHKALYDLKQAPKAWYERVSSFLISQKFKREDIDTTHFTKGEKNNLIIIQIYVDIVFG